MSGLHDFVKDCGSEEAAAEYRILLTLRFGTVEWAKQWTKFKKLRDTAKKIRSEKK